MASPYRLTKANKVVESGQYFSINAFETTGQTDVVMKLFGPNSQTSRIAEDDDAGAGLNSRIAADLMPGDYFVQIRHCNRSGGTGSYGIRVKKGQGVGREAGVSR